ncbi:MAG: Aminopeptidase S (Leu, Val, Phe, Tyr preference) [uncultured Solirubrobacterales bacterium]|uniref:Aminopeptidase S (Leu, Val, Phe, Tyr preference) n=1 Tax=uncultured Solirubrobacterales bacterium TaxID=768556 RepID=A0A6J4SBA5_9ACTN|nr:MAG: Aminopeptidase S (Leu, Val, Phe, Tyr preference) [uncultured Solirubrobacterales bacterium]
MDDAKVERLAELIVGFGANVQPGQIVAVSCEPGKEYLVRAIAASAYRHGASFVDVSWFDPWVKRARIEHAGEDTLDFVPPWYGERILELGRRRAARIALSGPVAPGVLSDLDPVRAGRDRLPAVKESGQVVNERTTNWTIGPCPTPAWAALVHPDLDPETGLERLWEQIVHVCRLDEPDPVAAWNERRDVLVKAAATLTDRGFDAIHYEGPGTDLTVGLLPGARWQAASFETIDGLPHMPNLPTEEVFTTPDPARTQGHVRSTTPLVLTDGTVVRGLEVRFEGGRIAELRAETGGETLRTITETDDGAARLGEIALVDGAGRIGALDTILYDTLLDENAASHIALGQGFPFLLDDPARSNESQIHIDFMIGSPEMTVTGLTRDGRRVPVLVQGAWQI